MLLSWNQISKRREDNERERAKERERETTEQTRRTGRQTETLMEQKCQDEHSRINLPRKRNKEKGRHYSDTYCDEKISGDT